MALNEGKGVGYERKAYGRRSGSRFTPPQSGGWTVLCVPTVPYLRRGRLSGLPELLGVLHERFLDQPDTGAGGFFGKLPTQLASSPAEAYQLMGEALYVYYLPISTGTIRAKSKEANVKRVLEMSPSPVGIPPERIAGFEPGLAGLGRGLQSFHYHIGTMIETVEQWKERESGERESLLKDPWAFKDFLYGVKLSGRLFLNKQNRGDAERHFLLHIVFPEHFESSLASDKNEIAGAGDFASLVTEATEDVDRKIYQIRQGLEAELGRSFSFYNTPIVEHWRGVGNDTPVAPPPTEGLQALADQTYLPTSFLEEIKSLLEEKRQVIFQGPPGTGKTFVAQMLAAASIWPVPGMRLRGGCAWCSFIRLMHTRILCRDFGPSSWIAGKWGLSCGRGRCWRLRRKRSRTRTIAIISSSTR